MRQMVDVALGSPVMVMVLNVVEWPADTVAEVV